MNILTGFLSIPKVEIVEWIGKNIWKRINILNHQLKRYQNKEDLQVLNSSKIVHWCEQVFRKWFSRIIQSYPSKKQLLILKTRANWKGEIVAVVPLEKRKFAQVFQDKSVEKTWLIWIYILYQRTGHKWGLWWLTVCPLTADQTRIFSKNIGFSEEALVVHECVNRRGGSIYV